MTDTPTPFLDENDQTRARRDHLEAIRALVGNAYPNRFPRTNLTAPPEGEDTITSVVEKFKSHEPQAEAGARPTPEQLEAANAELKGVGVRVSGRVATPPRVMGKVAFVHLSDGKSRLQIYVRKDDARALNNDTGAVIDEPESGWQLFNLLDHGDFVGVAGHLFVTKTGELSVHVRELQFLAKALVPMPDKLHGISDPETGRRQRYVDLIAAALKVDLSKADESPQPEAGASTSRELSSREVFERRSRLITELRRYLDAHGYIEVETPMLTPIASGAAAKPFETFHNALGIKLYARIAPELYLKRLLVGGFEKVYELNRNFRNEGIGYRWNPEFTMLEFYCAYMDVNGMMDFCEAMLRTTIENAIGTTRFRFGDVELGFSSPFERLTMKQAIAAYWPPQWNVWRILGGDKFDVRWLDDPEVLCNLHKYACHPEALTSRLHDWAAEMGLSETEKDARRTRKTSNIWSAVIGGSGGNQHNESEGSAAAQYIEFLFAMLAEESLIQPTFITDFPKPISPLSKASPVDPSIAERFELYVAGMEIANGFSELNDPVEQYERFRDQEQQRDRGDEEAMAMDEDYVRALSYGMPPAAGIGIGIDRLTMLLTNRRSIRDVILFPHMRPQRQTDEADE